MTSTSAILDRLVTLASAIEWPSAGTPAFNKVAKFDSADRTLAYGTILLNEARTCVVVINGIRWESEIISRSVVCDRLVDVTVMVSECVLGNRQQALFGKAGTNPGALYLAELVVNNLTGPLLGDDTNDVAIMPKQESIIDLEAEEAGISGRVAVLVDFTLRGGQDSAALNASFNS